MNDFASGLILSTNTISCNTDMPQSRDISQRATKSLLLHLKKSKPAKLITGLMTSEQHKNSWIFISFWTTLSFSKETGRKRNCSTITYTLNVLLSECNTWKTSFSLQTVNISKILKKKTTKHRSLPYKRTANSSSMHQCSCDELRSTRLL